MHRFVHIGDLHLGPNERNADRRAALDQIIAENINQPVSAWLIPGDLNHGRMTIDDRNWLKERFKRMADHAPIVTAYGNHDLPGDLDIFADLHTVWDIFVVARPDVIRVPLATSEVGPDNELQYAAIFVLPYPTRAGLVAAGTPSERIVDAAREALDIIFMSAAAKLTEAIAEGYIPMMIGHINVGGSITSSGQPNIGREIELDPALFQRLGPIGYIGLNHIHKAQYVAGAVYAGSICRLDWGEVEPKSYVVLTVDMTAAGEWTFTRNYQRVDVAPMYHVEGELTREWFDWRIIGDDTLGPISWDGCEVRVRYRFAAAERAALNFDLVKAPFAGAKRIDTDPIAEHTRALRAPEVTAAQTLEEKAAAFVRASGVSWTPSLDAKVAELLNPDGAAFLTNLETSLSGAGGSLTETLEQQEPVPDNEPAGVGQ